MRLDLALLGHASGENPAFNPTWALLLTLQLPQELKSQGSLGSSASGAQDILPLIPERLSFEGGWLDCLRLSMKKPKAERNYY